MLPMDVKVEATCSSDPASGREGTKQVGVDINGCLAMHEHRIGIDISGCLAMHERDWNRETPWYKTADSQVTDAFTVLARIVGFFGAENVFLVSYVDSDQKKREVCEWLHKSVDVCHKCKK